MALLDTAVLALVDGYRNHLSPRKGWQCASGVVGGETCSTAIRDAVAARGALASIRPAMAQFIQCGRAMHQLSQQPGEGRPRVQGVCCCGGIPIPFRI